MSEQDLDYADELEDVTSEEGESTSTTQEQVRQPVVNWQNDPEYRKQQAKRDRELEQARQAAMQAQQIAAQMQAQMEENSLRGLDGEALLVAQNQLLQKRLGEQQRQRDLDAYAMQRQRDLEQIVRKTGVPLELIEEAPNVHVAWDIATDYKEQQAAAKRKPLSREEEIERDADDRVDFTSPKPRPKSSAVQRKYDEARKKYDIRGQLEAMAEADEKGVTINEW